MKKALKISLSVIAFALTMFVARESEAACQSCSYVNDDGKCEVGQFGIKTCVSASIFQTCKVTPPNPCL